MIGVKAYTPTASRCYLVIYVLLQCCSLAAELLLHYPMHARMQLPCYCTA